MSYKQIGKIFATVLVLSLLCNVGLGLFVGLKRVLVYKADVRQIAKSYNTGNADGVKQASDNALQQIIQYIEKSGELKVGEKILILKEEKQDDEPTEDTQE